MLCGGRHQQLSQKFEDFLAQLQSSANLVFFEDGSVRNFETWTKDQDEKYEKAIAVIEKVNQETALKDIADVPVLTTTLSMIREMAIKYGKLVATVTKKRDAELVRFANNNSSVLAIIAESSDLLIFSGHWRYFSLNKIEMKTLKTIEYDKSALRKHLSLNDLQLRVLSTIVGNDIVQREKVEDFHGFKFGKDPKSKFPRLAAFIRQKVPDKLEKIINYIALVVMQDQRYEMKDTIRDSMEQYETVRNVIEFFFES